MEILFWWENRVPGGWLVELSPHLRCWNGHGRPHGLLGAILPTGSGLPLKTQRSQPSQSPWEHSILVLLTWQFGGRVRAGPVGVLCIIHTDVKTHSFEVMQDQEWIYFHNRITFIWLTLIKILFFAFLNQRQIKSKYCLLKHETLINPQDKFQQGTQWQLKNDLKLQLTPII